MPQIARDDLDHILTRTLPIWEELREARLLITGGTGFFGCWLVHSLCHAIDSLKLNTRVSLVTRNPQAFSQKAPHLTHHPAVQLIQADVQTIQLEKPNFTHVIHAATEASARLNAQAPLEMLQTTVDGTRRILDICCAGNVKKLLLTSSGAVYGEQPPDLPHIDENYTGGPNPLSPASAYAEGKRLSELWCVLAGRQAGFEVKIARCFAFVGPYLPLDQHFAIGNFIRDGLAEHDIQINGDGTPLRSYLYAADLAIWLWTILLNGANGQAYNVGSEEAISIAELARTTALHFDPPPSVAVAQKAPPGVLPKRYVPATRRAQTELGLKQWIDLDEALKRTIEFHRSSSAF